MRWKRVTHSELIVFDLPEDAGREIGVYVALISAMAIASTSRR
jgi:hypothetical protein